MIPFGGTLPSGKFTRTGESTMWWFIPLWLVVWNMTFMTFHILGMSSSQATFTPSFFRGVGRLKPPTSYPLRFPLDPNKNHH